MSVAFPMEELFQPYLDPQSTPILSATETEFSWGAWSEADGAYHTIRLRGTDFNYNPTSGSPVPIGGNVASVEALVPGTDQVGPQLTVTNARISLGGLMHIFDGTLAGSADAQATLFFRTILSGVDTVWQTGSAKGVNVAGDGLNVAAGDDFTGDQAPLGDIIRSSASGVANARGGLSGDYLDVAGKVTGADDKLYGSSSGSVLWGTPGTSKLAAYCGAARTSLWVEPEPT